MLMENFFYVKSEFGLVTLSNKNILDSDVHISDSIHPWIKVELSVTFNIRLSGWDDKEQVREWETFKIWKI